MATPGKDPQIVKDGPLQTLNVLLFKPLNTVQFCFCCVDMSVKEKKQEKHRCERCSLKPFSSQIISHL